MLRRALGVLAAILVLAGMIAVGYAIRVATEPEEAPPVTVATSLATVVRTDLVQTEILDGTLGYAEPRVVRSGLAGTVTWLPDETARLARGSTAFEIDGLPVIVFLGERPAWRPLSTRSEDGDDVAQLEENLLALGYGPEDWVPDREFDTDTADAVEAWREDMELPESRSVELGRILYLAADSRVGALTVDVGSPITAGSALFGVTSFEQQVVIDLDPDDIELVAVDDAVVVTLPDDREVGGRIVDVGRVVAASGPEPGSAGVIEVTVELERTVTDLDQAPVEVEVERERVADVLAVPVRALIALSDGGYAVEVDGRLIQVETGDFADGLVEIAGAVEEGDQVVVPR